MDRSLYQDFVLNEDNCHAEPIHRPLAIGGDGHMLAFQADGQLVAASDGVAGLFGLEQPQLWLVPPTDWLPPVLLEARNNAQDAQRVPPPRFSQDSLHYDVIAHVRAGVTILELEESSFEDANTGELLRLNASLAACTELETLCDSAARFVQQVYDFDRVMIYRFDEDEHGFVLGEAKREHLEPFLGLHYPATDIPKIARDLFLLNRTRAIPDIDRDNHWLEFRPGYQLPTEYLDLTNTQLRATSPIHIQYLRNMGVRATFTVAIVLNGTLWGLFACHHYSPIKPTYSSRMMAELVAQQFVGRLIELNSIADRANLQRSEVREAAFLESISIDDRYQLQAYGGSSELLQLCQCDGAAIVARGLPPAAIGTVPSVEAMHALRDAMVSTRVTRVASHHLRADFPDIAFDTARIGGVLAVRVSEVSDTVLLWFSVPQRQVVIWAGDQRQPNQIVEKSDAGVKLSPRASFEKWQQVIGDQSERWPSSALAMTDRVRRRILDKELDRTAALVERSNREFMELTYAAAHDLQEPLRTQLSYLKLIEEDFGSPETPALTQYLQRSEISVQRMQALIVDLLDYTQLGNEPAWEPVNLSSLLEEVVEEFADAIVRAEATVQHTALPLLMGDRNRFAQVFRNLLSNALKYVAADQQPVVEVSSEIAGQSVIVRFKDNGIGIATADINKVFRMYTRLHHRRDYAGTGIGLAIAQRAIESMGGSIGVDSSEGAGSTFWIRLSRNLIAP
ncbi:MAG: ATP-binding protein [Pseudomonadales bacterium]